MKSKKGSSESSAGVDQNRKSQGDAGSNGEFRATGTSKGWEASRIFQDSWREAGWFEQWERVARHEA
ncbi:MAG TPA: hypothetical protein VKY92_20665 [Verrucomicrobiae bacterium]|nr:hypothetical protein [Verrucomicrobiae bacterium]